MMIDVPSQAQTKPTEEEASVFGESSGKMATQKRRPG